MNNLCPVLLACVLTVSAWLTPQPPLSVGRLYVYGNQALVLSNFYFHGYDPAPTGGCGMASISPAHLGQLAWVSIDGYNYAGPCRIVDAVAQSDAAGSILGRHEIAEVSRATAARLGFQYGHAGYVYFGACPPPPGTPARAYTVPATFTDAASGGPAIFDAGYPPAQAVRRC